MKWQDLLAIVGQEPVFTSSLLRAGATSTPQLRVQLSRWTEAGRIIKLRRGVYTVAPPFRRIDPHPFVVANHLRKNSYVSLQAALAHHGLIPEHVPVVSSVTTARPEFLRTMLGSYQFKHIKRGCFFGFRKIEVSAGQEAFIATPEKALLDLVYLTPGGSRLEYIEELRLQNLEVINPERLRDLARRMAKPRMVHAVKRVIEIAEKEDSTPL